jgi:hypothetical protein
VHFENAVDEAGRDRRTLTFVPRLELKNFLHLHRL